MTEEQKQLAAALTPLQRMTVIHHVSGGMSQRQAYYAAGGKAKNEKAADAVISRMLSDVKVRSFYQSLVEQATTEAVMTREEALTRLSEIARTKITDVAEFRRVQVGEDKDGNPVFQSVWRLKNDDDIDKSRAAVISELAAGSQGLKFKLHSPLQAMKQLADLQGWDAPKRLEVEEKRPPLLHRNAVEVEAEDGRERTH